MSRNPRASAFPYLRLLDSHFWRPLRNRHSGVGWNPGGGEGDFAMTLYASGPWIPAFAGMTVLGASYFHGNCPRPCGPHTGMKIVWPPHRTVMLSSRPSHAPRSLHLSLPRKQESATSPLEIQSCNRMTAGIYFHNNYPCSCGPHTGMKMVWPPHRHSRESRSPPLRPWRVRPATE